MEFLRKDSVGPMKWRVGTKIKLNVYEGKRPVCQCHNKRDAKRIVDSMNSQPREEGKAK